MAMHQIAKITFEAEVKTHPQVVIEEFDFKVSNWYKNRRIYTKDDGLSRYTLQKIDKKIFILTIEQLDLFGIELGGWNEKDYPERENIINGALKEIEKEIKNKIKILEINRKAI
jgi:hypothetical protein